jgi:flagellar protein FliL
MADATPAAESEDAAPAKKGSKLLVVILAAIIAAVAAGGGVYFFAGGKSDAPVRSANAANEKQGAPKSPAVYVKFDPPFVVNFEAKGMMRFLQVSAEIMTRDPATVELIKLHEPMLRNDLLMLFGSQSYETISTREGKEQLRKEALNVVAKVIAAEGGDAKKVEQLYFTSFVMQ